MSLVASGQHYIRDGMGTEQLYDLSIDPFEMVNLMGSARGSQGVQPFRRMLLDLLTDNPGSIEVENAYLKAFRQGLKSLVEDGLAPHVPITAVEKPSNEKKPLLAIRRAPLKPIPFSALHDCVEYTRVVLGFPGPRPACPAGERVRRLDPTAGSPPWRPAHRAGRRGRRWECVLALAVERLHLPGKPAGVVSPRPRSRGPCARPSVKRL